MLNEYNGILAPPPKKESSDPIKSCKYLLPCGYCEFKKENCRKSVLSVKEVLEELIEQLNKDFPNKTRVKFNLDGEDWTLGYHECFEDLKRLVEKLEE